MKPFLFLITATLALLLSALSRSAPPTERDRSPSDLALSADGRWAVTANTTADTASLVDLSAGVVAAEVPVGRRPFAVALSRDGKRAVVTNWLSNTATLLEVAPPAMRVSATIPVGEEPRGVALTPEGTRAFVALAGEDRLAVIDLNARRVLRQVEVGSEPWHVALSPDGQRLAVGNVRSQDITVLDAASLEVSHVVRLRGRNVRHLAFSPDGAWAYAPHISERGRPVTKENIDNGWITASRLSRAPMKKAGPREAIALDPRGRAVGDADGVAVSPDGNLIAVTAGGTHELLLLRLPLPFVAYGGPADHIEPSLLNDPTRFRRVPLGGRPLGVSFTPDGGRVVVANYLLNAVQIVEVRAAQIVQTIPLGGPTAPSLARRGEVIFYDAQRSFNQWYSCNTCHVEGHTNGGSFDTLNDGSYNTPKKTLSLRGVVQTGPWTWHGWKRDLRELVRDSMTKSMQGPEPSEEDLDALMAYLATLDFRPRRRAEGARAAAIQRGEALFQAKGCQTCHAPPHYTADSVSIVGLESPDDAHPGFNPPSLRGVGHRAPYLHDGRAATLTEVLTTHHRPSRLTGRPDLTPEERDDLIAFLESL